MEYTHVYINLSNIDWWITVVKELDGLSKGVKVESSQETMQKHRIHHYDDVSTRAKKSLDFIKAAKSHVK